MVSPHFRGTVKRIWKKKKENDALNQRLSKLENLK